MNPLKAAVRRLRGIPAAPVVDRAVRVRRQGSEIEATYQVAYNSMRPLHRPVYRTLNTRLLDQIHKDTVVVAEFGVWRGAFLENLAIHAAATGKRLVLYGFDSFGKFPDIAAPVDLRSRPHDDYAHAITTNPPASAEAVRERLVRYDSVMGVRLVAGDITKIPPRPTSFNLVHFDMDFYAAFGAAMAWVENVHGVTIAVDDYYQPSWVGIVDAVNEFAEKHHLYRVNFSDYFRIERSLRTQWIALLLPLREAA